MKIRTDFVTNSSSSSFVTFGIISPELETFIKEMDEAGKLDHWDDGDIRGPEACSGINTSGGVINVTRDIFEFYSRPGSLKVCDEDLDDWMYNENNKYINSDTKKILKYEEAYNAIEGCFNNLSYDQENELKNIIKEIFDRHKIDCLVYKDMTDSFCGQDFSLRMLKKRLEEKYGLSEEEDLLKKRLMAEYNEYLNTHTVSMKDVVVKGSTFAISPWSFGMENFDNAVRVITDLGGKVTKQISGNTDYEAIPDEAKDTSNKEIDIIEASLTNLRIYNERRLARKKKPGIEMVLLSDFMKWLNNR